MLVVSVPNGISIKYDPVFIVGVVGTAEKVVVGVNVPAAFVLSKPLKRQKQATDPVGITTVLFADMDRMVVCAVPEAETAPID
jgi:hypothetical protein